MQVFTHDVWGAADAFARRIIDPCGHVRRHRNLGMKVAVIEDGCDLLEGRVHARADVRIFEAMVALVVDDRPLIGALVDPARTGNEVRARARLVPQAPTHDRGVVLVALESAHGAIHVGIDPTRVVGGVVNPVPRPLESVGLDISLEHDP